MEQAVLISIKPKWVILIESGEKTVEVRKTKPLIETPFKCFIYETAAGRGKVVGEFICPFVQRFDVPYPGWINEWKRLESETLSLTCLTYSDLHKYGGSGRTLYAWHISGLKMYDTPKEINEFKRWNRTECYYSDLGFAIPKCENCRESRCMVQKAPQSWCYVQIWGE